MTKKRRRRSNPWRILLLIALIAAFVYINQVVVPVTPPLFIPTPTPTTSPESFVNQAEALFDEGKLLPAIDAYEQAILADPANPSNYIQLARTQIFAGEYESAQENAELALLHNPDNSMGHTMRAWAMDFQQNYLEAEAAIKRAVELDPNNPVAHAVYAEILIDKGDFGDIEDAIEESRIAWDIDNQLLETRRARGYVLYWTSNYDEAIHEYKAALSINNKIPNLHLMLGYSYFAQDEYDLAVESFNQANALNPSDPAPDYETSRVYFIVGEYTRAAQYAEQAVKDDPSDPYLQGNLGIMLRKANRREEAVEHLALAVHGGITSEGAIVEGIPLDYTIRVIEIYSTYGLTLARLNRCNEAVPIFQAMLRVVPDDEIAVYNANEGISICQESIEDTPTAEEPTETP